MDIPPDRRLLSDVSVRCLGFVCPGTKEKGGPTARPYPPGLLCLVRGTMPTWWLGSMTLLCGCASWAWGILKVGLSLKCERTFRRRRGGWCCGESGGGLMVGQATPSLGYQPLSVLSRLVRILRMLLEP